MKQRFSEKFEQQLLRAIAGHAPWKAHVEKVYKPAELIPPSPKQIEWLEKYKRTIPTTKAEATRILSEIWEK